MKEYEKRSKQGVKGIKRIKNIRQPLWLCLFELVSEREIDRERLISQKDVVLALLSLQEGW